MKDSTKAILMTIIFLLVMLGLMIYGSYRNHQIDKGNMELVYQYGGDL